MTVSLIIGTKKGAAILTSDKGRRNWKADFALKGWPVTASARDGGGRYYTAVANDVFGPAVFISDDLKEWKQLESAPRFNPGDKGNEQHIRIAGAADFMGRYKDGPRLVDQIWTLHAAHGGIYAGTSEAGLFVTRDRGKHRCGRKLERSRERIAPHHERRGLRNVIRVQVPPVLRAVTGGARMLKAEGNTVREVFEDKVDQGEELILANAFARG